MIQHYQADLFGQLPTVTDQQPSQQGAGDKPDAAADQRQQQRDEYKRAYVEQRLRETRIWERRINDTQRRKKLRIALPPSA